MEKPLKCVLLLSLKEMALRRVAGLLWSGSDILASISKVKYYEIGGRQWREAVEEKIKDQVLKLEIPESLAKQMIDKIRPMRLEVSAWIRNHECCLRNLNDDISPESVKLYWTTAGTINYKRTAEELVHCEKLDVEQRYRLSCCYCMEHYISLYWEKLPEEKKRKYCDYEVADLPYCWPHILKGELSKLDHLLRRSNRNLTSFNQWAFEHSAEYYRKTAAGYFFNKLTHEEREASLTKAAALVIERYCGYSPCERRPDVLRYLLSVMTPEQQMETIKARPVGVLLCFLYWPLHDLFPDNAGLLWTFIPPSSYAALLKKIVYEYKYNHLCFPTMFKEFFVGSPPDFKNCFIEAEDEDGDSPASRFLSAFFDSDDSESIEVMLRNLDAADRAKLLCHRSVHGLFYRYMRRDKWHLVEVCLREAALPEEEKGRLKNEFKGYLEGEGWELRKFKRFFEFLDHTDASSDKRVKGRKRQLGNCSRDQ